MTEPFHGDAMARSTAPGAALGLLECWPLPPRESPRALCPLSSGAHALRWLTAARPHIGVGARDRTHPLARRAAWTRDLAATAQAGHGEADRPATGRVCASGRRHEASPSLRSIVRSSGDLDWRAAAARISVSSR
jgi:hypothetical protein